MFPECSSNAQNWPKKTVALDPAHYQVRDCHVAPAGYKLVARDYSGAEAVLAACYMRDWQWYEKMISGADVHSEHAQHFYNISVQVWDELGGKDGAANKPKRNTAKNVTYAGLYTAGPPTIQKTINRDWQITGLWVTLDEVTLCRNGLLQLHPLEEWWGRTMRELTESSGITRNCFGYRRVFRDPDPEGRLKDALSNYPQSTVAWLVNGSIIQLRDHFGYTHPDRRIVLQVHDELLFCVRDDHVEKTLADSKRVMERPFKIHGREVFVPTEAKVGQSWGKMKAAA